MATSRKTHSSTQARERTQPPPASGPAPEKIAARAYQIWLESGRPEGKAEENWYRAERELGGRSAPSR